MFEEVKMYRCTKCAKIYESHPVSSCTCERFFAPGDLIGPFKLVQKMDSRKWKCQCLLCGMNCFVDYANINKQKSCGCKPRHVTVLAVSYSQVRYRCDRCESNLVQEVPVLEWCCNDT